MPDFTDAVEGFDVAIKNFNALVKDFAVATALYEHRDQQAALKKDLFDALEALGVARGREEFDAVITVLVAYKAARDAGAL